MTIIRDIYPMDDLLSQRLSKWIKYLDIAEAVRFDGPIADFLVYAAANWTITKVETGYTVAVISLQNIVGGVLRIVNDYGDNDSVQFQLLGEPFKLATGKPLWFEVKFRTPDPTEVDLLFGICITDTSLIAGFSDGVVWHKDDGDASLDFKSVKNSTATAKPAVGTLVANTWTRLAFRFDGYNTITPFLNGTEYTSQNIITNIPDDEELTVSFAIMNGEADAKTLDIDYIKCVQER